MHTSETYMIGRHARAHQQRDFALLVTYHTKRVTPEHAGALPQRLHRRGLAADIIVHNCTADELRAQARDIWQNATGRRAVWDGLEIHHEVPLEWRHMYSGDINGLDNLVGILPEDHAGITEAWRTWKAGDAGQDAERSRAVAAEGLPKENLWTAHGVTVMSDPSIEELIELARQAPGLPGQHLIGASDTEIVRLETEIGRALSLGFRRWLEAVNGAMLGPGGVFGIREPCDFLSIRRYLAIYPEWQPLGWVPVAGDGTGNYWVAVPQGPDGVPDWVVFVDTHEDPASVDRYVASNVLRFIRFLLKSELGETRWPGERGYDLEQDPTLVIAPEGKATWSPR